MLAVTKIEQCPKCGNENIVKNGFTRHKTNEYSVKTVKKPPSCTPRKHPEWIYRCWLGRFWNV